MEKLVKEPIRIAQIIGRTLNGGVENYVLNYYLSIDKSKFQFDFFIEHESLIINRQLIEKLGGKIFIIPSIKNIFSYNSKLKSIFKQNKYSIVQANNNSLSVISLRIAKKCNIPIRIANSLSTSNKNEFVRNIVKNILKKFSKRYATHYFACSNLAGQWLFGKNIIYNKNYYLVHNAVDIKKFIYSENKRIELKKKHNLENRFVVGTIGRLENQKNHKYLLDIFSYLHKNDSRYFLIIIGDGKLYGDLISKAKSLNINEDMLILTSKDVGVRGTAALYYNLFDIFVLTSLYEGLPTVGIEAQINGLPCLFASTITDETKVNDNVQFLDINEDDIPQWVDEITCNIKKRCVRSDNLLSFDISNEVIALENLYSMLLRGTKK